MIEVRLRQHKRGYYKAGRDDTEETSIKKALIDQQGTINPP